MVKKKRGRPRKHPLPQTETQETAPQEPVEHEVPVPATPAEVNPEVAGHAQGAYNIPAKQICSRHNTYMADGFCKKCFRENDPEYQARPGDRGMTAEESAYVRKHRGGGKNPDEVLAKFRERRAMSNG